MDIKLIKPRTTSLFAIISLLTPLTISAQSSLFSDSSYAYMGARLGWGNFTDSCVAKADRCDDNSITYGGLLGYQVMPYLALEAGVTDYGHIEAQYDSLTTSVDAYGVDLTALASYNIDEQWRVFGRAGAVWLDISKQTTVTTKENTNEWTGLFGVGIDYVLSNHWSIRGEYQFIDGFGASGSGQADLHMAAIGFMYRFGGDKQMY